MKTYKVSRPRLELQGSDALLKRQHRSVLSLRKGNVR